MPASLVLVCTITTSSFEESDGIERMVSVESTRSLAVEHSGNVAGGQMSRGAHNGRGFRGRASDDGRGWQMSSRFTL